jgi:hypothetical protein
MSFQAYTDKLARRHRLTPQKTSVKPMAVVRESEPVSDKSNDVRPPIDTGDICSGYDDQTFFIEVNHCA